MTVEGRAFSHVVVARLGDLHPLTLGMGETSYKRKLSLARPGTARALIFNARILTCCGSADINI
jgi:hypothetical protein